MIYEPILFSKGNMHAVHWYSMDFPLN